MGGVAGVRAAALGKSDSEERRLTIRFGLGCGCEVSGKAVWTEGTDGSQTVRGCAKAFSNSLSATAEAALKPTSLACSLAVEPVDIAPVDAVDAVEATTGLLDVGDMRGGGAEVCRAIGDSPVSQSSVREEILPVVAMVGMVGRDFDLGILDALPLPIAPKRSLWVRWLWLRFLLFGAGIWLFEAWEDPTDSCLAETALDGGRDEVDVEASASLERSSALAAKKFAE